MDTLLEAHERVVKTLRWGYTHGLLRAFTKRHPHGPAKRSLRSMVTTMALHERVVNTLLGLHSRVAPNVYQEPYHGPVKRSLRSMVPTMALHARFVNTLLGLLPFFPGRVSWRPRCVSSKVALYPGGGCASMVIKENF